MSDCLCAGSGGGKSEGAYVWSKEPYTISNGDVQTTGEFWGPTFPIGRVINYSHNYHFDEQTGKCLLVNPQTIEILPEITNALDGKYIVHSTAQSDTVCMWIGTCVSFHGYGGTVCGPKNFLEVYAKIGTPKKYVVDDNASAYKDSGFKDGYKYVKVPNT